MEDTDTLLALLASVLDPPITDQAVLLDALAEHDGDVQKAAQALSEKRTRGTKRKRKVGLDGWLQNSSTKPELSTSNGSTSMSKTPSKHRGGEKPQSVLVNDHPETPPKMTSPVASTSSHSTPPPKVRRITNDELMAMLRPSDSKDSSKPGLPRMPPLMLGSPELVAQHTPCTYHSSILPSELACRLFYTMILASSTWQKNKWWLFDRVVESPHRTSFYARQLHTEEHNFGMREVAQYWYNGRPTETPPTFPPEMEEACEFVERMVNVEMRKRKRFTLEWGGDPDEAYPGGEKVVWKANVAASNCYEGGKESVGFHTDQLTYLGPYATIASLSLGVSRKFRLREVISSDEKGSRSARTYDIPLHHNSLVIMHGSCQEIYKHSIPPQNTVDLFRPAFPPPPGLFDSDQGELKENLTASNARINITFRFYRPDFRAELTPRCKCNVPCILRPDMKNRYPVASDGRRDMVSKYWWTCYAGAQNDGKGCNFWKVMDVKAEGRGPFVSEV